MRKIIVVLTFIALFNLASFAQTSGQSVSERRIIEVIGSAETLVTPNEFTFKITLLERIENKQKISIEMQEANLRRELSAAGIDVVKNLTIFDLDSFYISRKKVKDTLGTKDYRLKLTDVNQIEKLQDVADRLNLQQLSLVDTSHSDIASLRKETKMEAIKAAKAKAEYLLGAIGERVGKPVYVSEGREVSSDRANVTSNFMSNGRQTVAANDDDNDNGALTFSKIRLRYEVFAKFEIE